MKPDITIAIPVRNGAKSLPICIASIIKACLKYTYEIIVVDGGSNDGSVELATSLNCEVYRGDYKLLAARRKGSAEANGNVVLLIDCDQILLPESIDNAMALINKGADMVALGERVFQPSTFFQKCSDSDKQLINLNVAAQLDPLSGVILPRMFKKWILDEVFSAIPLEADKTVLALDHAIIYYEASKISSRISFQVDAILHCEPEEIQQIWSKNFRWGKSLGLQRKTQYYSELIGSKNRRRLSKEGSLKLKFMSFCFLAIKAPAFFSGQLFGVLSKN